jgi:hypothetical protein
MLEQLLLQLNIPEKCISGRVVPKTAFYEEATLSPLDRKRIKNDISKVKWLYVFKPETINIAKYVDESIDFSEVSFVQVELENLEIANKIIEIIHKTIQYPLVLFVICEDDLIVSVADKRKNLVDSSKLSVQEIVTSQVVSIGNLSKTTNLFFDDLRVEKLDHSNFYTFYKDIKGLIISLKASEYTNCFIRYAKESSDKLTIMKQIETDKLKIITLRARIKNEKQINRQTEVNIEINNLQKNILNLIQKL